MEHFCEICGETKPCGKIVALRATEDGGWVETSETVVCGGDCAEAVGGVAAASVKSWLAKAAKARS